MPDGDYPVQFSVDYPDRPLNRLTTFFRIFTAIPILILLAAIGGGAGSFDSGTASIAAAGSGLLFLPPLLMILFRRKYPRWWFDWNLELLRFSNRIYVYVALMDDRYPSTDEGQSVRLDFPYPDAERDLNRWLPLVKWFLAIPHYIVLAGPLGAGVLLRGDRLVRDPVHGRYPRGLFGIVESVSAGETGSRPTRSSWSPTATRRSASAEPGDPLSGRWSRSRPSPRALAASSATSTGSALGERRHARAGRCGRPGSISKASVAIGVQEQHADLAAVARSRSARGS